MAKQKLLYDAYGRAYVWKPGPGPGIGPQRPKPQDASLPEGTVIQVLKSRSRRRKLVPKVSSDDERKGRVVERAALTMIDNVENLERFNEHARTLEVLALFADADRF